MDFVTTHAAPVTIRINGKAYNVPRFLLTEMKERMAEEAKKQLDAALEQLPADPDVRARWSLYWRPPVQDVVTVAGELLTPEGVDYLLRKQLGKAGVPSADIDALIASADPVMLQALARRLSSAEHAVAKMKADSGEAKDANPPSGPPQGSGGAPAITDATTASSPASTAA